MIWAFVVYLVLAPIFVGLFAAVKMIHALKVGVIIALFPAMLVYLLLLK